MIKISYRFSILIFLIVIMIITLSFCKYRNEYFSNIYNIELMPNLLFIEDDNIIILHKNDENIKKKYLKNLLNLPLKKTLIFTIQI